MQGAFPTIEATLQTTTNSEVAVDLDDAYQAVKPYSALADDKARAAFASKLDKIVSAGFISPKSDSLLSYLQASTRGRFFLAVQGRCRVAQCASGSSFRLFLF